MLKLISLIVGILFFLVGIVGLFLPVIPQVPFFVLSFLFLMLGSEKIAERIKKTDVYQRKMKPWIQKNKLLSRLLIEKPESKTGKEQENTFERA